LKILQLTKKFPWPEKDGEVIGILNLTLGFSQMGHEVTVLALNTLKHYFPPERLPDSITKAARFLSIPIDTDVKVWPAFKNLFSRQSYNVVRFFSIDYARELTRLLKEESFDIILVEGVYLMQYIPNVPKEFNGKILFRPQNVEYIIWERLANQDSNWLKRWYYSFLAGRMKEYEIRVMHCSDLMVTVSENDLIHFKGLGYTGPGYCVPTGYRFEQLPDWLPDEEHAVGFIGGMDWIPNREGIQWFLDNVWPLVLKKIPDARFYLAGRNFPADLLQLEQQGVVIMGEVDDARSFILSKSVSICPLFAGSGMRVKIVEAMALGRAVISTTIGAESLMYTQGVDLLIADEPGLFASHIVHVLMNKSLRVSLGKSAQQRVLTTYDNRSICGQIIELARVL